MTGVGFEKRLKVTKKALSRETKVRDTTDQVTHCDLETQLKNSRWNFLQPRIYKLRSWCP